MHSMEFAAEPFMVHVCATGSFNLTCVPILTATLIHIIKYDDLISTHRGHAALCDMGLVDISDISRYLDVFQTWKSGLLERVFDLPCICSVCASPTLLGGDIGNKNWLRNSPSCSSAISVLTLRDRQPGFMSGRLISPDSIRLRATSAKQMSYSRKPINHTHKVNHSHI